MASSHELQQIAIALLVPLYVRCASLFEFAVHLFFVAAASIILVRFYNKPFDIHVAVNTAKLLAWSRIASYMADFVIIGNWKRLLLAYIISLDGMGGLLPERMLAETREILRDLRTRDILAGILCIPIALAFLLSYLWIGSYKDQGSLLRGILCVLLTTCILAIGLQQLVFFAVRSLHNHGLPIIQVPIALVGVTYLKLAAMVRKEDRSKEGTDATDKDKERTETLKNGGAEKKGQETPLKRKGAAKQKQTMPLSRRRRG
ncbi:hypothetical protein EJ04DRAFT_565614 [Polyplosphaeria fusca]|uniref:Uncharacterized protein n=1 Tax=Polyplosphaeria fusca TaxID=682080 RepID=A0A9P4V163_9PLEO|nr:hypothetical protein EJ04DRAFT_565614 [Polyplosphaeria fusca]